MLVNSVALKMTLDSDRALAEVPGYLLHSFGSIHDLLEPRLKVRQELAGGRRGAEREPRILAPDLRGHGRTLLYGHPARINDHQRYLDTFLRDVAGAPAMAASNSMGAVGPVLQAAPEQVAADAGFPVSLGRSTPAAIKAAWDR
ncbi:MAG: alpha/beta fold hydrolase [Candidatus Dormibacter sp.]|uniref:alpha/beta fold hydrolase n=1 Tax=Candidatus Dormibacter sp. TaxID=2973982 RepID=UPI000DB3DC92|nr:MAG: hypothetical protein DLM66_02465 [Candidatus Dormibacteraeota bacterium]